MATVAGFLGYVNYREPYLGKALDYLRGAGLAKPGRLEITMPAGAAATEIVLHERSALEKFAVAYWRQPVEVAVLEAPQTAMELTLFPVENSKLWNQIAFFLPLTDDGCEDLAATGVAALVVGKPDYRKMLAEYDPMAGIEAQQELIARHQAEFILVEDLPALVDRALPRAQKKLGIVHLVTLGLGRRQLLDLDYACCRLKEHGTPVHEGPLQVKAMLGRLHAVFPGQFSVGLSLVHFLASQFQR